MRVSRGARYTNLRGIPEYNVTLTDALSFRKKTHTPGLLRNTGPSCNAPGFVGWHTNVAWYAAASGPIQVRRRTQQGISKNGFVPSVGLWGPWLAHFGGGRRLSAFGRVLRT